ncbi:MAG: hypothetical protein JO128_17550 [Alphaproteobacteria bacterium]|nr:hypothetical protein [Alphaproteobacteria bacterium]
MTTAQRRDRISGWRTDGIVMASLWTLVAILWAGIAVAPRVFGGGLC